MNLDEDHLAILRKIWERNSDDLTEEEARELVQTALDEVRAMRARVKKELDEIIDELA